MNTRIPKRLAKIGGILIATSGIVNTALGARIGAIFYDAYPGGKMGHVGIIAGIGALALGLVIVFLIAPMYNRTKRGFVALGGISTIILGHLGAIAGAIYVGTIGVALCYVAGLWAVIVALRGLRPQ
jgi:hypothetical protein